MLPISALISRMRKIVGSVERNLLTLVTTIAKASSAKYNNAVERALD